MFKFNMKQTVWYLENNEVHSASILSRQYVDNYFPSTYICTTAQNEAFSKLGTEGIRYATIHGVYPEHRLFESREALAQSILTPNVLFVAPVDESIFKFKMDQEVWYIMENEVYSGTILSIKYVDNHFPQDQRCTAAQEESFAKLGNECTLYATIDGIFTENELFNTKEELVDSLTGNI